jgi:hypothetical protein
MSPALRDYAFLWRSAAASRAARPKWIYGGIALVGMLLVGLLVLERTSAWLEALKFAVRVPVVVWAFAALTDYVPGAILMNTPANARLVPRLRRRLVELTVGASTATVAAAVLLAWDTTAPAGLVAIATLAWLAGLGLGSAGYQTGVLMQAAVPVLVISPQVVPEILFGQPFVAGIGLLLLALGARTVDLMFPNGGDRHWTRRHAHARAMERTRPEGLMRQAANARFAGALYVAALRRNSTQRRAPAFLLAVLGPALHWTQRYMPLLALVGLAAVLVAVARGVGVDPQFAGKWVVLLCQGLLFAQLFAYAQRSQRLGDTRTEQSVLRLAPSFPAAARPFNRQLNAALLRMAVLDWLAVLATLMAVSAIAGVPRQDLVSLAQLCCLTLPLVGANLRNHARHAGSDILLLVAGLVASVACSLGVAALAHWLAEAPLMPVAAFISMVLALVVAGRRWHVALAAPHAFPAGRLS